MCVAAVTLIVSGVVLEVGGVFLILRGIRLSRREAKRFFAPVDQVATVEGLAHLRGITDLVVAGTREGEPTLEQRVAALESALETVKADLRTARKEQQEALDRLQSDLREEVARRTRSLDESFRRAIEEVRRYVGFLSRGRPWRQDARGLVLPRGCRGYGKRRPALSLDELLEA